MSRPSTTPRHGITARQPDAPAGPAGNRGTVPGGRTVRFAGPDLRLLGLLAGGWLAVLLAIRLRPSTAVAVGAAALAAAGCLAAGLSIRSRRGPSDRSEHGTSGRARRDADDRPRRGGGASSSRREDDRSRRGAVDARRPTVGVLLRVLLTALLGAGGAALVTAAHTQVRYSSPLAGLAAREAPVRAHLVLTGDPRQIGHLAYGPTTWLAPARMDQFRVLGDAGPTVRLRAPVLVFGTGGSWRSLLPGQPLTVTANLGRPEGADITAAVLSVRDPPLLAGRPPWYQRAAGHLRAGLRAACRGLPTAPGGLLPGLVDGDTSMLDPIVEHDFTTAGMTHLTAVSGSNLAIVLAFVLFVARWGRAGPRLAAACGVLATIGFVVLVRPEPSVLRAALMGGLGLAAMALHRPRAAVPGLAAAAFVLLLADPGLAVEWGFALSVFATLGLLLWAPGWREALRRRRVPRGVAEVLAVSLAAHVACAPLIAALTGTVGLAAVPANVLAEPAVAPATVLGVGAALLSTVSPAGAHLLAWLAAWPCRWLVLVAGVAADAPAAVLPWPGGVPGGVLLAAVVLALIAFAGHRVARRLLLVAVLAALLTAAPVRWIAGGWPPANWVFTACDVGQGDGLVLNAAPAQAVVVDTGREPTSIDRCLRALGVRSVPLLVLTHDDADHVGGIDGVFDSRTVGAVAVSRHRGTAGGRERVERAAAAHGLTPFAVPPGWVYRAGALRIEVLGTPEPLSGTESDTNNNCVVLRVATRGISVLLTGDAGPEEQAALRESGIGLHADVLKVPHHGSAHQDSGFLAAVAPRVAVVSVGADNDYGQPNAGLLRRFRRAGVRVCRTDRQGDVAIVVAAGRIAVAHHAPAVGRSP